MITELQIYKDKASLLDGHLQRAKWAIKNAISNISALSEYDNENNKTWVNWRERYREHILNQLNAVDKEIPIETSWVPKIHLDQANARVAAGYKTFERYSESIGEIQALKDENRTLREELERATSGRQRISFRDALRYRDLQIQQLKRKLHDKVLLIKNLTKKDAS